ncbi:MAG: DUF1566 domain-containing protein [Leptospiraceae bacterium]|nr:DUF1566 domain-containing protein [Leptospiraceae bacterium]
MKFRKNAIIGLIAISFSLSLFSQENNSKDGLIQIEDLLWDTKENRSGLSWEKTVKYCLNKGMRLPSKSELFLHQVELSKLEDDRLAYDMSVTVRVVHRLYWSSTEYENDSTKVWQVKINTPDSSNASAPVRKSYIHINVRCVKDAEKK